MSYLSVGDTSRYSIVDGGCTGSTSPAAGKCCWDSVARAPVDKSNCGVKDPSLFDKLLGYGKQGLDVYAQGQQQQGTIKAAQAASMQGGGMPGWLLPVGLGVVALGAVLVLTKKRAPQQNPARRAKRRRRKRMKVGHWAETDTGSRRIKECRSKSCRVRGRHWHTPSGTMR